MNFRRFATRLGYRWRGLRARRNRFRVKRRCADGRDIEILGPFVRPFNVANRDGRLYVTEMDCHRVIRFDGNWNFDGWIGNDGRGDVLSSGWHTGSGPGRRGDAPGSFARPHALAIHRDGSLWVTELDNKRIQVMSAEGRTLRMVMSPQDPGAPELAGPVTSHFAPDGTLYVADFRGHSIHRFAADGSFVGWLGATEDDHVSGGFVRHGNARRSGNLGGFNGPHAAVPILDGSIIVADTWNHRLVRMTPDGRDLHWLGVRRDGGASGGWTDRGQAAASNMPGGFNAPVHVDRGNDGMLYVIEFGNHRIQRFTPEGAFAGWMGRCAESRGIGWHRSGTPIAGRGPGFFFHPYHFVVRGNSLVVADTENGRLQRINLPNER